MTDDRAEQEVRRYPVKPVTRRHAAWCHSRVFSVAEQFPCDCGAMQCNCTDNGAPYCGDAECDIDFCQDCGDEYTDPCLRHEGVDHV